MNGKYALVRQKTGQVLFRSDNYGRLSRTAKKLELRNAKLEISDVATEIVVYSAETEAMLSR